MLAESLKYKLEDIARIAHETNKSYCELIGDKSQTDWFSAPEWQRKSAMSGVLFHLDSLTKGQKPEPSASHNVWLAEKEAEGWKFGPIKNPELREHPEFVPYSQLPIEQKMKDYLFCAVVEAFYTAYLNE